MKIQSKIPLIAFHRYFGAVEIAFTSREDSLVNITICRKKKGKLILVDQLQSLRYHQAAPIIEKLSYFHLIISGKVVIHKHYAKTYEENTESAKPILPDSYTGEFSTQSFALDKEYYGSTIRKELLEHILSGMIVDKYYPKHIYIGSHICRIFPKITGNDNFTLHTLNTSLEFTNGIFEEIVFENNTQGETFKVGDDVIHSYNVPGLCACLNDEVELISETAISSTLAQAILNEAREKKKFKRNLFLATSIVLFVVFANFISNRHYSNKYAQLDEKLSLNRQSLSEIERLEKDIAEKKSLLGNRSFSNSPVISLMTDQIGAGVPENIRIYNMEIFPLSGKIQKEKAIGFDYNKILAEGFSLNAQDVDVWIEKCKQYKWVKDVSLIKYNFDNNIKKGVFKIELIF